jgi:hypothetical protein
LRAALDHEVAATFERAEAFGSVARGLGYPSEALFGDVYAELPAHLREQLRELQTEAAPQAAECSILPFEDKNRRAAG